MANDRQNSATSPQSTQFTLPIFLIGALGGVALDILSLYFVGFPTGPDKTLWWHVGVGVRVIGWMVLTGVVACLFSNGQLRNAFVIGVAAPSILLNVAASVQRPKETIPTIPSIAVPSGKSTRLEVPLRNVTLFGPSVAEAQAAPLESRVESKMGQLRVILETDPSAPSSATWLKASTLGIFDETGAKPVAMTVPPSQDFIFSFPSGKYTLLFVGRGVESSPAPVKIEPDRVKEITLAVNAKKVTGAKMAWEEFLNGITLRFKQVTDIKKEIEYGGTGGGTGGNTGGGGFSWESGR